jgi:CheY-like chemotaxis protein
MDKIFEPFFTTKETGKGTGLGLSMVYGFTKQSGGYVRAHSEVGRGTTIYLYFPRFSGESEKAGIAAPNLADVLPKTATILLVEDDDLVRKSLVRQLESLGHRILSAENGRAGLAAMERHSEVALVISDVVMEGGMSGPDMVEKLRERTPGLKVIFISGYTEGSRQTSKVPDADVLLSKPVRNADLAQAIAAILEGGGSIAPGRSPRA